MDDFIKAFDNIVMDSSRRNISVFSNPLINNFWRQYLNDLSKPDAFEKIKKYIDYQRDADAEYPNGITEVLPDNMKGLQTRLHILNKKGEDGFYRIQINC